MKSLEHILGASARMNLLRALLYQHSAVGLRQLARLAEVHPHSAERVMKDLLREQVVTMRKTPARTLYTRNPDHPDWCVLKAVCDGADRAMRELRRPELDQRAQSILPFIREAGEMLKQARGSLHVS